MPIKGLFNQKQNHEMILEKIAELEKKQKRFNALEVHVKRILAFEEEITPLLNLKDKPPQKVPEKKTVRKEKPKSNHREDALHLERSVIKKISPFIQAVEQMDKQIRELEINVLQIQQSHIELTNRIDAIEVQLSRLQEEETKTNEEKTQQQPMVIKEINIDKFYLDRYEQNNNFAQLGIKDLSGALNIGATYGREVMPKELSEQIKEDMKEFKGMKKEFGFGEDESSSPNKGEESSSTDQFIHDNETFTEIPIEVVDEDD
ncbi:hypothetical protein ACFFF5_15830 [Lederbergia wuyishanensis]|uniref:TolA-binding protein n=1 Tax=Lederbergia wuyishanensis TaxID=1347903 RepID=A0ABU0D8S1_9BACI|nr:hypothetical protein [Lederbergia wuyishanensis]MCJ8007640.1 hypothetical protein [Lederbergia wuyishanensis]MDQ0344775.1 TolA-binding protein [Lederbergia wuyishanensis]